MHQSHSSTTTTEYQWSPYFWTKIDYRNIFHHVNDSAGISIPEPYMTLKRAPDIKYKPVEKPWLL